MTFHIHEDLNKLGEYIYNPVNNSKQPEEMKIRDGTIYMYVRIYERKANKRWQGVPEGRGGGGISCCENLGNYQHQTYLRKAKQEFFLYQITPTELFVSYLCLLFHCLVSWFLFLEMGWDISDGFSSLLSSYTRTYAHIEIEQVYEACTYLLV